jgi:hypothetical protein
MKVRLKLINSISQNVVDVQRTRHPVGTLFYFRDRASAYFSVSENLPLLDLHSLIGRDLTGEAALRAENAELRATVAKYAEACDPKKQLERIQQSRAERLTDPVEWAAKVRRGLSR